MFDEPLDDAWESADLFGLSEEEVKNARKTPPKGYPKSGKQYADPAHKKYPIDAKHIRAAVSYFNQGGQRKKGGYSQSQWSAIGGRIAGAANRLIGKGYSYSGGKIQTPGASEATTPPPTTNKKPKAPPQRVTGGTTSTTSASGSTSGTASPPPPQDPNASPKPPTNVAGSGSVVAVAVAVGKPAGPPNPNQDPDNDGDNDTTAAGDTDGDYVQPSGAPGPKAKQKARTSNAGAKPKQAAKASKASNVTQPGQAGKKAAKPGKPGKPGKKAGKAGKAGKTAPPATSGAKKTVTPGARPGGRTRPAAAPSQQQRSGPPSRQQRTSPRAQSAQRGSTEEELMRYVQALSRLDLVAAPAGAQVLGEEIAVNGVPCFQYESMVVPADSVSRNTVPGKRGRTYYSGRRMQQYYQQNVQLLAEMQSRGEHVDVYPRHAAAAAGISLPAGWVDGYTLRQSATRAGLQDMWYRATIPLTSEGQDLRLKLRAGLVKYSSLRSFPAPDFDTQPVKVNGEVVEEVTSLPIAGIDLVATKPGLPVEPIQLLEEVRLEPATTTRSLPPSIRTVRIPSSTSRTTRQESAMKITCPCGCGQEIDVSALVEDAVSAATEELQQQLDKETKRRQGAEEEASTMKKKALKTAKEAAEKVQAVETQMAQVTAKSTALEEEIKSYGAVRDQMATLQQERALGAKVEAVLAEDKRFGKLMRPIVTEELKKAGITDPEKVAEWYWKLRGQRTDQLMGLVNGGRVLARGMGVVHFGTEEDFDDEGGTFESDDEGDEGDEGDPNTQPPAGGAREEGDNTRSSSRRTSSTATTAPRVRLNAAKREVLGIMGRMR